MLLFSPLFLSLLTETDGQARLVQKVVLLRFFLSLHLIHQFFRRYTALYVCKHIGENLDDEIVGHVYLFLKEQLQMPPLSGVLHGTIIGDVTFPIVQGLIKSNGECLKGFSQTSATA
uniref:Uncharacterized protein n=1 Tax=Solanum lycopersicum TaxID=4081 RepID=K4BN95_SOLLC